MMASVRSQAAALSSTATAEGWLPRVARSRACPHFLMAHRYCGNPYT